MQFFDKDTVDVRVVMARLVLVIQKVQGTVEVPQVQYIDRIVDVTVCGNNSTIHPDSTEDEGSSSDSVSYSRGRRACGDTATGANVPEGAIDVLRQDCPTPEIVSGWTLCGKGVYGQLPGGFTGNTATRALGQKCRE